MVINQSRTMSNYKTVQRLAAESATFKEQRYNHQWDWGKGPQVGKHHETRMDQSASWHHSHWKELLKLYIQPYLMGHKAPRKVLEYVRLTDSSWWLNIYQHLTGMWHGRTNNWSTLSQHTTLV